MLNQRSISCACIADLHCVGVTLAKIRILLIEDNRILREGITALINKQRDITVAAVSEGSDNTLTKARALKPHVVLLDLGLDNQNSLLVAESVKKELPGVKIIGMRLAPAQSDILEFVQAEAEGFILKNATVEDVIKTIRAVARGETVLPPPMTGSLFSHVAAREARDVKLMSAGAPNILRTENYALPGSLTIVMT